MKNKIDRGQQLRPTREHYFHRAERLKFSDPKRFSAENCRLVAVLYLFDISMRMMSFTVWSPELKWVTYGRLLPPFLRYCV